MRQNARILAWLSRSADAEASTAKWSKKTESGETVLKVILGFRGIRRQRRAR